MAPLPLVATYAYVNPIVAVILGALVLGEPIEPRTLVAGAIIVGAVALIVTARSRMAGPRVAAAEVTTSARTVRATRRAKAITVIIGLTPMAVGNSDESATYRPVTIATATASARTRPFGSHGCSRALAPIRTVPIWWAEKTEPRFGRKSMRSMRSSNRPNAAASALVEPRIG